MIESPLDRELITAYLKGDEGAFETLYMRYKACLFSYLNRMLQNQYTTADDLFQHLWMRIIASLPNYAHQEKFLSWALRIAHNLVMDHYRSRKVKLEVAVETFDAIVSESATPGEEMDYEVQLQFLEEAMANLSPSQCEVVSLRKEGVSFKEIAQIQGVPLNTAIGRMHDAMRNLKKYLENKI